MLLDWTGPARRDMASISHFISRDNPAAADRLLDAIQKKAARLLEFPELAPRGGRRGTRELIVHPSYRLVYRVDADTIFILRVLHTARRWP